jgi:hypothetical protein
MRFAIALLAALIATPAAAQDAEPAAAPTKTAMKAGFMLLGHIGFSAEAEFDKIEVGGEKIADDNKEDLDSNLGIAGIYEMPFRDRLYLGVRLAATKAEGDDTEQKNTVFDGGLWGRYLMPAGGMNLFLAGAAGPSFSSVESESGDELSGIGLHVVLGGGIAIPSGDVDLIAGLFYSHQLFPELVGDVDHPAGGKAEVTVLDAAVSRMLLSAGARF